jgi:hypothetical protein
MLHFFGKQKCCLVDDLTQLFFWNVHSSYNGYDIYNINAWLVDSMFKGPKGGARRTFWNP